MPNRCAVMTVVVVVDDDVVVVVHGDAVGNRRLATLVLTMTLLGSTSNVSK